MGESNYQPALKKSARGMSADSFDTAIRVDAVLVPEPTNKYDANAVRVDVDGRTVGYLAREDARDYQPVLMEMLRLGEYGWCSGRIMGGGRKYYGIHLHIGPPDAMRFGNSVEGIELLDAGPRVTVSGFDIASLASVPEARGGRWPPIAASLSLGKISKGKHEGRTCIDVSVNATHAGSFTAKMSERYLPTVHPLLSRGKTPGCELAVQRDGEKAKAWAYMPD